MDMKTEHETESGLILWVSWNLRFPKTRRSLAAGPYDKDHSTSGSKLVFSC